MLFWRHFLLKEKDNEITNKNNLIKNKKLVIKEKEIFAETLYSYIKAHSDSLDISFINWELNKINKNIIIDELEKSKNNIKDKISETNDADLSTI